MQQEINAKINNISHLDSKLKVNQLIQEQDHEVKFNMNGNLMKDGDSGQKIERLLHNMKNAEITKNELSSLTPPALQNLATIALDIDSQEAKNLHLLHNNTSSDFASAAILQLQKSISPRNHQSMNNLQVNCLKDEITRLQNMNHLEKLGHQ